MKAELIKTIEKYDSIVVYGHVNPDGDSFGSQVAMKAMINENYPEKKVFIAGTGMKNLYPLLGRPDIIDDETIKHSLAIAVDFNVLYRSEDQRIKTAPEIIMVDHHEPYPSIKNEFPISIIRSNIAANTTILYQLFKKNHLKMNRLCRNALFYGITTDTNRFMFLEENQESFSVAYELLELGIDMTEIYNLNLKSSEDILNVKGYILTHYKKYGERVLYAILPRSVIEQNHFKGYPGWLVNLLANVIGREAWVLFIEGKDNENMSVEIRSSKINVRPVSIKFGGGGHTKACGIQKCVYSQEMIDAILNEVEQITKEKK